MFACNLNSLWPFCSSWCRFEQHTLLPSVSTAWAAAKSQLEISDTVERNGNGTLFWFWDQIENCFVYLPFQTNILDRDASNKGSLFSRLFVKVLLKLGRSAAWICAPSHKWLFGIPKQHSCAQLQRASLKKRNRFEWQNKELRWDWKCSPWWGRRQSFHVNCKSCWEWCRRSFIICGLNWEGNQQNGQDVAGENFLKSLTWSQTSNNDAEFEFLTS